MANKTYSGKPKPAGKPGHFYEPERHRLQARGIHTGHLANMQYQEPIEIITSADKHYKEGNRWYPSEKTYSKEIRKTKKLNPLSEKEDMYLMMEFRDSLEDKWVKFLRSHGTRSKDLTEEDDVMYMMEFRQTYWPLWEKYCHERGYKAKLEE
jgi:hypothetical protein